MFLISIFTFILPLEISTTTICTSNETILISKSHIMLNNQITINHDHFQLTQQFQPFTIIGPILYQLQHYNLTLITRAKYLERCIFVFQNTSFILIRVTLFYFTIMQDKIANYNFTTTQEISTQQLGLFLNAYYYEFYLYLLYEDIIDSKQYLLQIIDHNNKIVLDILKIKKQQNCSFYFDETYSDSFYFAQLNCSDWVVQIFTVGTLQLKKTFKFEDFKLVLRQISSIQMTQQIQFTFDNFVYNYQPYQDYLEKAFSYQNRTILFYDIFVCILSDKQKGENDPIKFKAIIRQEIPKSVLYFSNGLILLFDSHIELVKNTDLSFNLTIQFDKIFSFNSAYPYFIGVKDNQIILLRVNQMNPLFKCIENKSFNATFYKDQYLNYYNSKFTMSKKKIENQLIQFINISKSIFYQVTIPTIVQEVYSNQLVFEINLNNYILGGPFEILNPKSDQNSLLTYDDFPSQICQFLNSTKILWWVIINSDYDPNIYILAQYHNLFLYQINCNLLTEKKLIQIEKIEKSQIFKCNNFILMRIDKYRIYLFQFEYNLLLRKQQVQFMKEIKFIQTMNTYFFIYFEDKQWCEINYSNKNYQFKKLEINSLINQDIILYKQIAKEFNIIGTETQILFKYRSSQHVIDILDFYNILAIKQRTDEFLIIHKSGKQDQIKIQLCKYYLQNFQFVKLYELPKPTKSFEYIWPIYLHENGFIITISAIDTITNHTFVLIYELSQTFISVLKDIIQVDCGECFTIFKQDTILYQFNNKLFQKKIELIKLTLQIQNDKPQIKYINISFELRSKIKQYVKNGFQIQLIIIPFIEGLELKNNKKLTIKNSDIIVFDPRNQIIGTLKNITSSSVIITPALKLISQSTIIGEFPYSFTYALYKDKIMNEQMNIKNQKDDHYVLIEENGEHSFILNVQKNSIIILVFDSNDQQKNKFEVDTLQCMIVISLIQIEDILFIFCENLIFLYDVSFYQTRYINQINHEFIECTIEKIDNKPLSYIAYDKKSTSQQYMIIEIVENNQMNTIYFVLENEKHLNILSEISNRKSLKYIHFYEDNYLIMTEFYFKSILHAQLIKLVVDISLNQTVSILNQGIIRYQKDTELINLLFINQFLIILLKYKIEKDGSILQLYDLHENQKFEIFDSISYIEGNIQDIMYHNNQSFKILEKFQHMTESIYQISQYQLEFPNKEGENYIINLSNQLNQIEMIIEIQNHIYFSLCFKLGLIFVNLLFILLISIKKRNKIKKQQFDEN